ncbi:hypothetical protein B0H13DRAFT_2276112 [Mycena leptocephala]|nr:hypothetical protein B0H13DRAFT_2276112 [Mycena leptocephala]
MLIVGFFGGDASNLEWSWASRTLIHPATPISRFPVSGAHTGCPLFPEKGARCRLSARHNYPFFERWMGRTTPGVGGGGGGGGAWMGVPVMVAGEEMARLVVCMETQRAGRVAALVLAAMWMSRGATRHRTGAGASLRIDSHRRAVRRTVCDTMRADAVVVPAAAGCMREIAAPYAQSMLLLHNFASLQSVARGPRLSPAFYCYYLGSKQEPQYTNSIRADLSA